MSRPRCAICVFELKVQHIFESDQKHLFYVPGYYGNEIDGVVMPKAKGKKEGGDGDEEETELIQNSSEDEMEDDGGLNSVATTPPMKPVITDRSDLYVVYKHYRV